MNARQWAALTAIVVLLAAGVAAIAGTAVPLCVVAALALIARAATAPVRPGTYRRRSTGGVA